MDRSSARTGHNASRPDLTLEFCLKGSGVVRVAGLDEAGRGAWAGPVVAAAVMLPLERFDLANLLQGVRDSKQMTPQQREQWSLVILNCAVDVGFGIAPPEEVDHVGLMAATHLAMHRALRELDPTPQHLLVDHLRLPDLEVPQTPVTKGDASVLSIAAASVLAKVHRDALMRGYAQSFPGYGFSQHKGYGTQGHRRAIRELGPCAIHRLSFSPLTGYREQAG